MANYFWIADSERRLDWARTIVEDEPDGVDSAVRQPQRWINRAALRYK